MGAILPPQEGEYPFQGRSKLAMVFLERTPKNT